MQYSLHEQLRTVPGLACESGVYFKYNWETVLEDFAEITLLITVLPKQKFTGELDGGKFGWKSV